MKISYHLVTNNINKNIINILTCIFKLASAKSIFKYFIAFISFERLQYIIIK